MTAAIRTIESRTKSGKPITVAVIPVSLMTSANAEVRNIEAAALAVAAGCGPRAWRLVDDRGVTIQLPSRTHVEAAATSGPANERHDW